MAAGESSALVAPEAMSLAQAGLTKRCPRCGERYPADFRVCPRDAVELELLVGEADDPYLGATLAGSYRIDSVIADGGMGRVYEARHTRLPERGLEFEKVARELNRNFNVEVQKWDEAAEAPGPGSVDVVLDTELAGSRDGARVEGIEGMPAITEQILARWLAGDVIEYLNQLLRDNRGGTRLGFSLSVVSDILFLIELKEVSNKMESDARTSWANTLARYGRCGL